MTYDYHVLLGLLSVALGVLAYTLYFRSIFRGATKPHLFTWLVYFLVDIVVFPAQVLNGGGPGAWVTLTGIIGTCSVAILSLRFGEKHITRSDWTAFILALGSIVLWILTGDPLLSVVISAVVNFLAMAPTFRKAYVRPEEESLSIWIVDAIRFSISIIALSSFSVTTALFPLALVTGNVLLIGMILFRRRQLAASSSVR